MTRKRKNTTRIALLTALAAATITACGGGGGGGSNSGSTSDGSSVTSGTVTALGSIVVNGRHIETEGPEVEIEQDGKEIDRAEVEEIGKQVRVDEDDDGRRIEVDETVRGPIDSINSPRLTVMGQTVVTGPDTVFDDSPASDLGSLAPKDVVEVSGLRDNSGAIRATHIEKESTATSDNDEFKLTGKVTNHDTGARTFEIGGLVINYGILPATLDELPSGEWNDLVVEVEDANRDYVANSGDQLQATKVEREDNAGNVVGAEIELERIVTDVDQDNNTFEIGGDRLVSYGNAEFRFGSASDLVIGLRVEVEGVVRDDGSIRATKVKFDDNSARISGTASGINASEGTLTVLGVTVRLAADDVEFDNSFDDELLAGLDDLTEDDFLEIEGRIAPNPNGSGSVTVIAHEIEVDDADQDRELRGTVSAFAADAGTLTLLGIDVKSDGSTRFEGGDDQPLTRGAFFDRIVLNATVVEAKWDEDGFTGTDDLVKELSIEDEDEFEND